MNKEIMLTEDQIRQLFEDTELIKKIKTFKEHRSEYNKKWKEWINRETINKLSKEELRQRFIEYYKSGAGRHSFNQIYRNRIVKNVERFRKMLDFLFKEDIDIKERINEILEKNGKYKIDGVGKALVSSFLFDYNSDKYCIWNNKVNAGLEQIGWLPKLKGKFGDRYVQILNKLNQLKEIIPEPYNNFNDIDSFLHIIAVEPEGEHALKKVLGESVEEAPTESLKMMEKTLQDFLIKNFERIFPALKIYEDEEGNGVEYPTGVGRIDILAVEKENKNKVVIELKADVASSNALGQILSYMQWVEENLIEGNERVKGIIIAKDMDKKLQFALKKAPDVEFYKYMVHFDLKKIKTK